MAASAMGSFGLHKQAYQKAAQNNNRDKIETIWISRRHNPLDMRMETPVPRFKLTVPTQRPQPHPHWVPVTDPPLSSYQRPRERNLFPSHPAIRSQEWSTLRQMLPSWGFTVAPGPPSWGTAGGESPFVQDRPPSRFPIIDSPMSRYVDSMHTTNKLFKLH